MKMVFGLFVVLLVVFPAMADNYTYTYTGNTFGSSSVSSTGFYGVRGGYSLEDFVSGYFTIAAPLAANLSDVNITADVLDFEFTDNRFQDRVPSTSNSTAFYFSTDAQGNIVDWFVAASILNVDWVVTTKGLSDVDYDEASLGNRASYAYVQGNPGTWTVAGGTESPVPEPSSAVLLGSVMLVVIRVIKVRRSA
jgi:hypothetical protein